METVVQILGVPPREGNRPFKILTSIGELQTFNPQMANTAATFVGQMATVNHEQKPSNDGQFINHWLNDIGPANGQAPISVQPVQQAQQAVPQQQEVPPQARYGATELALMLYAIPKEQRPSIEELFNTVKLFLHYNQHGVLPQTRPQTPQQIAAQVPGVQVGVIPEIDTAPQEESFENEGGFVAPWEAS